MKFSEKLYSLRKSKDLSQDELAEKLSVSRQAISRWEMGTAEPSAQNLIELSNLFGVSIDCLLKDNVAQESKENAAGTENVQAPTSFSKPKQRYDMLFIVSVALIVCHVIGVLNSIPIFLFVVSIPFAIVIWSLISIFHIINIVILELVYRYYKKEPHAKAHRRRYYRISVWFFAFSPSLLLSGLIVYFGIAPIGVISFAFLFYFIICGTVTFLFRNKRPKAQDLDEETKENS